MRENSKTDYPADIRVALQREKLRLIEDIIVVAAKIGAGGESSVGLSSDGWNTRFNDLKDEIDAGRLPGERFASDGTAFKRTLVLPRDLCRHAAGLSASKWDWLRDYCQAWVLANGDDSQGFSSETSEPPGAARARIGSSSQPEQKKRGRRFGKYVVYLPGIIGDLSPKQLAAWEAAGIKGRAKLVEDEWHERKLFEKASLPSEARAREKGIEAQWQRVGIPRLPKTELK